MKPLESLKPHRGRAGSALSAVIALVACGDAPGDANPDYLVLNPERLAELRVQCRMEPARQRAGVCRAVSEATRRRFMGEGTPYTPSRPAGEPPAPSVPSGPSAPTGPVDSGVTP